MTRLMLIICLATLLLIAGVASAFEPGARRGPEAGPYRLAQAQAQHRDVQREPLRRPLLRPNAVSHPPEDAAPPHETTSVPEHPPAAQRPGHLSPDERAALRRQIDEAGRDVYRPQGGNRP